MIWDTRQINNQFTNSKEVKKGEDGIILASLAGQHHKFWEMTTEQLTRPFISASNGSNLNQTMDGLNLSDSIRVVCVEMNDRIDRSTPLYKETLGGILSQILTSAKTDPYIQSNSILSFFVWYTSPRFFFLSFFGSPAQHSSPSHSCIY